MPLVNAKCTNCGGTLQVDNEKDTAVCPFCGSAFLVEKAVQNYHVVVENNIRADVVNIYNDRNKDFVIEAGILRSYRGSATRADIPEGVTEIAEGAFSKIPYLSEVSFPTTLRKICRRSFSHCTSLRSLRIGDNVQVENFAFIDCENVEDIRIGDGCDLGYSCLPVSCLRSLSLGSLTHSGAILDSNGRSGQTIEFLEIRDNAVIRPKTERKDMPLPLISMFFVKHAKIGNNVQTLSPLFYECAVDELDVKGLFRCNGYPLIVAKPAKQAGAGLKKAIFADAPMAESEGAKCRKSRVIRLVSPPHVLLSVPCKKTFRKEIVLRNGFLHRCLCCGKEALTEKDGEYFCKKCKTVYIFENRQG